MAEIRGIDSIGYKSELKQLVDDVSTIFAPALRQAQGVLVSFAGRDGTIDVRDLDDVQVAVGQVISRIFVGENGRSAFAKDGLTALAPFPQLLNEWYVKVTVQAVTAHEKWMKRRLPDDVYAFLSRQRDPRPTLEMYTPDVVLIEAENPFRRRRGESQEDFLQRMDDLRVFRPNPLAEYEPMHTWVDPRGYQLSRRIWDVRNNTIGQIDRLIDDYIRNGRSALDLADALEQYLLPGARVLWTNSPYGEDVSYFAMRLARSEIARAANQAAFISAYTNPYVNAIEVVRSPNGDPRCPVCPQHATIGIGGERLRPPYSVHAAHIPIYHPNCKCHIRSVVVDNPATVTRRLRAVMQDAQGEVYRAFSNAGMGVRFVTQLVGRALGDIVNSFVQGRLL